MRGTPFALQPMTMLEILVVDDEPALRMSVAEALLAAGHTVTEAEDGGQALRLILTRVFDVAIFDVRLPKIDGLTLFRRLRVESPSTAAVLMTAFATIPDAVASLRAGAHDYVTKPFDPDELVAGVIAPLEERRALRRLLEQARAELVARDAGMERLGRSPVATRVQAEIDVIAGSDSPLLIHGERGTGKRLAARTVHARGRRREGPYVAVCCASIPEPAFGNELFGQGACAAGSVAGGTMATDGRVRAAHAGTLLLDDVGAMPLSAQETLMTALRDGAVTRVDARAALPQTDVRLIATTHEDLEARVRDGTFREDLLCKLGVLELRLPPLCERLADLPLLFEHFLRRSTRNVPPRITPGAWELLRAYPFPGNIDELADIVKHAIAHVRGTAIDVEHLPRSVVGAHPAVV
jgi:DNA-binding NtrC family response regulator